MRDSILGTIVIVLGSFTLGFAVGAQVQRARAIDAVFSAVPLSDAAKGPAHAVATTATVYFYDSDGSINASLRCDRLDLGTMKDLEILMGDQNRERDNR